MNRENRSAYVANEALATAARTMRVGVNWPTPAPRRTVVRKSFLARLLGL